MGQERKEPKEKTIPDGHLLKIRTYGVHLALVDADYTSVLFERVEGVVQLRAPVPVAVVGDLVIVPGGHPSEVLGEGLQAGVATVL